VIVLGAGAFIVVLAVSAYVEADIRWLHALQSLMYFATILLCIRRNRWGYFIGASAALFWNYITLFVNSFLRSGIRATAHFFQTGASLDVGQFLAVPGWAGNALLLLGCISAYARLSDKAWWDIPKAVAAFVGSTGYFALAMAVAQPRYLSIFPRLLHPHLHLWNFGT